MKIRMLATAPGSVDGTTVAQYCAGSEYRLDGSAGELALARAFINAGLAEAADAPPAAKALAAAPENKALAPAADKKVPASKRLRT